jgi:hypothetical protein
MRIGERLALSLVPSDLHISFPSRRKEHPMARRTKVRRFEPRYGVSQAALEVEAGDVAREAEDYAVLAQADLAAMRVERHATCEETWQHVVVLLSPLSEKDVRILHCLLFRDLYHVLELYRTHVRGTQPEMAPPAAAPSRKSASSPPVPQQVALERFSEWLFDLEPRKE